MPENIFISSFDVIRLQFSISIGLPRKQSNNIFAISSRNTIFLENFIIALKKKKKKD